MQLIGETDDPRRYEVHGNAAQHYGDDGLDRERFVERVFDVAYFWKLDPAVALALPLSQLDLYETQALRIAENMRNEDGG